MEREQFIVLLDHETINKGDAAILLEGDGDARCDRAIELYKNNVVSKICFSGGFDDPKSGAYVFDRLKSKFIEADVNEDDIIIENNSKNTYEQAVEIMRISSDMGWKRIILVASHYHTYRAFLTFLHVKNEIQSDVAIEIAGVKKLDWYEETGYGKRIDLLVDELKKIDIYQRKGHVASYSEGLKYLKWKYVEQKK